MKILCSVYKSPREEGMYLYVGKEDGLSRVPEALLKKFGDPQLVMTMALYEEKKLARAEPVKVLKALDEQGFYLQMPITAEQYMRELRNKNTKL